MAVDLVIATYGFTAYKTVAADAVEFHMSDKGWAQSTCKLLGPEPLEIRCAVLSEIGGPQNRLFTARVFGPDGALRGEWDIHGVNTQIAQGADAFLYFEKDEDGFWSGVTLAYSRDRLAIHAFEIDPL